MIQDRLVIGLETHFELATQSKVFCGCATTFGAPPNSQCCPVCLGLPGALPVLNQRMVELAILAGLATHCEISRISNMDRKNYTYPDLPKAFQISQFDQPICQNGWMDLESGKRIRIARIHLEEDAGKLIHAAAVSFIDYNRCGLGLIEVVTEPDFADAEEVRVYLETLRLTMKTLGISDCKMQEGSIRSDVNISLLPAGETALRERVEIKNINSFSNISRAIAYEATRQRSLLQAGKKIPQETRRYDEHTGETQPMRNKETQHDYRFFREPDLLPIVVSQHKINLLASSMPELPQERRARLIKVYALTAAEAGLLVQYPKIADFFETAAVGLQTPATAAHFLLGQAMRRLSTENDREACALPISPEALHMLVELLEAGNLRMPLAKNLLEEMLDRACGPRELLQNRNLQPFEPELLRSFCKQAIAAQPNAAADYRAGKRNALKVLIGAVMRASTGRADPLEAQQMLIELLR